MTNLPKPRCSSRCEPGVRIAHVHLSHPASPSPASGILGGKASKANVCLLTCPTCPQPTWLQTSTLPHLTKEENNFFFLLISPAAELAKERRPENVPLKARMSWKGKKEEVRTRQKLWLVGEAGRSAPRGHERCHGRMIRKPVSSQRGARTH